MGEPATFKWARDGNSTAIISETHILPEQKRPDLSKLTPGTIPIIDLSEAEDTIKSKVFEACHEYGIFYLVNHGVDETLCNDVLSAIVEFFNLPLEQGRGRLQTTDFDKEVKVINYQDYDGDRILPSWSESFTHLWRPSDDSFLHALPTNPPHYRELIRKYAKEMGMLMGKLLGWMSEGLGFEKGELEKSMGGKPMFYKMQSNFYPSCPNPELTLGLPVHNDMAALAIIRQTEHITGLHFLKDDIWRPVLPLPNAFVCNVGDVIEVLSNGKYKSVRHRSVTNKDKTRVSLVTFIAPNKQTILGPIKGTVDEQHPPRYETFLYANFHERILRPWLHPKSQSLTDDKAV
ncbi:hypothetical protein RND81_13G089000 [Saponaria officinalis]|uniref:Fe2OG dioxygenase domain-containing protein n=1 Tax=Saponaria officinalis TaxID=3572 RepID=A0AAW1GVK9_SAPOF